ncbi:hypothetical protein WJ972_02930 [Achromobacter insuavis]
MPELLVWAGAGFAFAYVASLPILVFHATRSLEANGLRKPRRLSPSTITTGLLCATIALALARHFCDGWPGLPFIALLIAGAFCLAQRRRIKAASLGRVPAVEYAQALARKRASASEASERWVDEYVTSYRHLREHGNAAFILLLQAILCTLVYICLTAVPGYERWTWDTMHEGQWMAFAICFLVLVLWIAPAVSVHQLSQKLEAHLTTGRGPGSPETAVAPAPRPSAPRQPPQHPASCRAAVCRLARPCPRNNAAPAGTHAQDRIAMLAVAAAAGLLPAHPVALVPPAESALPGPADVRDQQHGRPGRLAAPGRTGVAVMAVEPGVPFAAGRRERIAVPTGRRSRPTGVCLDRGMPVRGRIELHRNPTGCDPARLGTLSNLRHTGLASRTCRLDSPAHPTYPAT